MLDVFTRWVNLEKGIFLASSLTLVVTGLAHQSVPTTATWGEPRCSAAPARFRPVSLEKPPALPGFLAGARGSPFSRAESTVAIKRNRLPVVSPPPPPKRPVAVKPVKKPPPPPLKNPKNRPPELIRAIKPKPYDLPVRLAGRVKVGDRDGRTVFVAKEDGRYVAVKEGEDLPGLGVKLVRATKSIVIVENDKGQRFRLDDLLRARAAAEAAGGGDGPPDENGGGH